ncbi:hypothetical protein COCVIDRAFT_13488 [Bipolaris victoriae FI3]|uniref:Uncharacterized protein n=1 Tax=Bipolaris victoriae (strain FI3) TaxID=930091 RepID=W7EPV6_BIPV3|nr:hypothetical protein COCVIDRAFT_13488 [Bipolaris victoriae FI3]
MADTSSRLLQNHITHGRKEPSATNCILHEDDSGRCTVNKEVIKKISLNDISVGLAVLANVSMFTVLVVAVFVPIRFSGSTGNHGSLSTVEKTIYVTVLTTLGTMCRAFTLSRLRQLWLRIFDLELNRGSSLLQIDPRWRTALDIGTVQECLGQWRVSASFAISILTVTAFVTGLSYNQIEETTTFSYYLPEDSTSGCMGVDASSLNGRYSDMLWQLPNGSEYKVFPYLDFCPTSQTMLLMGGINTKDPQNYGYGDLGVAVQSGAQGAPGSFYAPSFPTPVSALRIGLNDLIMRHGTALVSVHGCSPTLLHNPFSCRTTDVEFDPSTLSIEVGDQNCSANRTVNDNKSPNGHAYKICPIGEIGEATLVMAHIGVDAVYAAKAMGDLEQVKAWNTSDDEKLKLYGIRCDIHVSIQLRELTLTMADGARNTGALTRTLNAGNECSIPARFGLNQIKATAAIGAFHILYAGWMKDLRMVVLSSNSTEHNIRSKPYSFKNSQSALEDVLGLASALSLSRLTLDSRAPSVEVRGSAIALYNRVGPGEYWAVIFALPPLINVVLLLFLWRLSRSKTPISSITSSLNSLEQFGKMA